MTDSFEQNPLFTNDDRYKEIDGKFLQVGAQTARLPVSDYCLDVLLSNYLFGELGATGSSKQTGHTRNFRQLIKSAKTSFDQYAQSGPDRSYGFVLYKLLEFENYIIGLFNQVLEVYFGTSTIQVRTFDARFLNGFSVITTKGSIDNSKETCIVQSNKKRFV